MLRVNGCDLTAQQFAEVRLAWKAGKDPLWVERHDFVVDSIDGHVLSEYAPIENVNVAILQKIDLERFAPLEDYRYGS